MVAMEFTEIQPLKMFALLLTLMHLSALTARSDNVNTFYAVVNRVEHLFFPLPKTHMPVQSRPTSIHVTRRTNLFFLLREFSEKQLAKGIPAKGIEGFFAEHIKISASTLSQLKSSRNMGDKIAVQIEICAGKEYGWVSVCHTNEVVTQAQQAFEALAVRAWQDASAKERTRLMRLAKVAFATESCK